MELQIYENAQFGTVRTTTIDGEIMFVGKDVADILGYTNAPKAIKDHVDDEDKLIERIVMSGQNRDVILINESGLYCLILSSKKPKAREFKHWVTSEILPTIRRTGGYVASEDMFIENYLPFLDEPYRDLFRLQMTAIEKLNERIRNDKPLVDFALHVADSEDLIDMNAMAKLAADKNFNIGRTRLFRWLKEKGVLISNNLPYQRYIDRR